MAFLPPTTLFYPETIHLLPSWLDIDTLADLQAFISSPKMPSATGWRSYNLARKLLAGLYAALFRGEKGQGKFPCRWVRG